jgi:hypothetical protein
MYVRMHVCIYIHICAPAVSHRQMRTCAVEEQLLRLDELMIYWYSGNFDQLSCSIKSNSTNGQM